MIVAWVAPDAHGSPITSFRITLQQKDGAFSESTAHCDGQVAEILSATQCTIPLAILTSDPYLLLQGDGIFAKVVAINYYGESLESDSGNGAVVLLVPDAPVDLQDAVDITTAYVIGFTWSDGTKSGGMPVENYRILWDQST